MAIEYPIYHGTRHGMLVSILKRGVEPRKMGTVGNWKHTKRSGAGRVYLSNSYAIYFAFCATKGLEPLVVFEIDRERLDLFKLVPDEDWLVKQSTRLGLPKDHDYIRDVIAPTRPDLAYESLEELGNIAYLGTVPRSAITRYAIISKPAYLGLVRMGYDPIVGVMNQAILGKFYQSFSKWLFDESVEIETRWGEKIRPDRDGIRIVTV